MLKQVNYQDRAVDELVEKVIRLLNASGQRKRLVFKAPTGSGKTVMASGMLARLAQELPERTDSLVNRVAFIWIAPNKLHEQSYFKMKNYFTESRLLKPVVYDELDQSIDGYIRPGEILFVNWESINKDNALMIRETERSASLYDITDRTQLDNRIPIVVIVDEEHMFSGKNAKKSEKVLARINPKLEIRISATPISQGDEMVTVYREDVVKEEMIKESIVLNPALNPGDDSLTETLIREALAKRNEIAQAYNSLNININPLLLIQLPNDTNEANTAEDTRIKDEVVKYLSAKEGITVQNGRLAVWLSKEKENLQGIEDLDNLTEVLLFKQAIALGWDCPRAAVLLIFRKMESFTFTMQTLGRILRMPEQKFYTNPLLNKGYVYTDLSRKQVEIASDDMAYISRMRAERRPKLTNVELTSTYTERKSSDRRRLGPKFRGILKDALARQWSLTYNPTLFSLFEDDKEPADDVEAKKAGNRVIAARTVKIDVSSISVEIPKDLVIADELGTVEVTNRVRFARTSAELSRVFDDYCLSQLSGWEKYWSLPTFENALIESFDELLGVDELSTKKIVLYHQNRPFFSGVIENALVEYEKTMNMRRKASERDFIRYKWEIPEERTYNEQSCHEENDVHNHALEPFVKENRASAPEERFVKFLEANTQYIDWWYKNGESGMSDYAVPYTKAGGEKGLFYVDFIVRMKNGVVFLLDTKTKDSRPDDPYKHNGLIDYIASQSGKTLPLKGGVLIESRPDVWRFCPQKVENTSDLDSWQQFLPSEYAE
ncbi:MAG: DEAD/DEAH box helicase family protein [Bacteroidales bacterium]|nr:DEAD/DEAH box helicase family protein [Bacteroidales bacterium]